jgi:DUF971 family protein
MPTTIQLPPAAPVQHHRLQARRVVAVAAGAASVLILAGGGFAVANHAMTQHDRTSFTATGIRGLVVDVDAGDLTLVSGPAGGRVVVDTSRDWAWSQPDASHTVNNGVLTLSGDCPNLGVGTCRVNQRVTVPAGVDVRVSISSGDISATGLNLAGLDVRTDSGDITARNINARRVRAESNSGNVAASLSGSPDQVIAETSSGNVTLTVPDGAYNVDADTSAGQVHINVEDDPTAEHRLSAHSSAGDVTIDHR